MITTHGVPPRDLHLLNQKEGTMEEHKFCKDLNTRTIRVALVDGSQINACVNIDRHKQGVTPL